MSRRICVDLYNAIIKLRPDWHDSDDKKGGLKVVMTGSATDPLDWQRHAHNLICGDNLPGLTWCSGLIGDFVLEMYLEKCAKYRSFGYLAVPIQSASAKTSGG